MPVLARNLVADIRRRGGTNRVKGMVETASWLSESISSGIIHPNELSLRENARAFFGESFIEACSPHSGMDTSELVTKMHESGDGVSHTAFTSINKQIIYSAVMEAFDSEEFVASRLVTTRPTVFEKEQIPGMQGLGDVAERVHEGMPYPEFGFGEDYIETPMTEKHGLIVSLTREAIFFDRTGLMIDNARQVGEWLGVNKEKRILRVVLGIDNPFRWLGTQYNTYQSSQWTNTHANELVDWTDIDNSEQLFVGLTDPWTGEPIMVVPRHILVMPAKLHTARRIINSTEVRHTSGSTIETLSANPVAGAYEIYTSRLAQQLLADTALTAEQASKRWYHADFGKAFAYMQNWPLQVTTQTANSESSFRQDIVQRFKASERGVPAVIQPRAAVENTHA